MGIAGRLVDSLIGRIRPVTFRSLNALPLVRGWGGGFVIFLVRLAC